MTRELLEFLSPESDNVYVDCTLGGGGHAEEVLRKSSPSGFLIGFELDRESADFAQERLKEYSHRIKIVNKNFAEIKDVLNGAETDGIYFDLGVSTNQLESPEKGFGYRMDGRLDMRFDANQKKDAFMVVNKYPEGRLYKIMREYGEERFAGRIARRICWERAKSAVTTTRQLSELIRRALGNGKNVEKTLSRVFQAIRIEVNDELASLEKALPDAIECLGKNGRLCAISFHSLEDRIVKKVFKKYSGECICEDKRQICGCSPKKLVRILTKKPVAPSEEEKNINPCSRSAKLRAVERI